MIRGDGGKKEDKGLFRDYEEGKGRGKGNCRADFEKPRPDKDVICGLE